MKNVLLFILILHYVVNIGICSLDANNSFNYFYNLINKRNQECLDYEFPRDARMYAPSDKAVQEYGTFDFIIVGGGSTGCVLANRLSEIKEWTILLLEAGTFRDSELTGIPGLWVQDAFTKFNWGFESVRQKYGCLGNVDNKCVIPRGKGIGGSSLINGLVYSRGDKLDYDKWSTLLNDTSWSYSNVLPYFKKSENFTRTNPYVPIDTEYHGYNGPFHATQSVPPQNVSLTFLEGFKQLGYNKTDYNGKQLFGSSIMQYYVYEGRRYDSAMAFISPARSRKNLIILDKSYVRKLKISKTTKRVQGVVFTRDNKTYIARKRREVILSAGSYSTPQILLLSGVGPQHHLESLGIPVVKNLPVGKNLKDHPFTILIFSSNITSASDSLEQSIKDFLKQQGPLTRSSYFDAVGWVATPAEQDFNYPNLEVMFNNFSGSAFSQKYFKWTNETFETLDARVPNPLALELVLLHTVSTGTVTLKSVDPFDYPVIDLNILSDEGNKDIETLYQSIKMVLKLIETEAFRSLNIKLAVKEFPGCNHLESLSREFWYCYIRKVSGTAFHPVGTCATGTDPEKGVVDNQLKVFGLKDLRIADASVIPFALTSHTNAACTMIGEKAAELIKKSYKC